jgi:hypothetical protein
MSRYSDSNADELSGLDEVSLEPSLEQGPTPSIAPAVGTVEKVVTRYSHCGICGSRLHFNYISDFSRNTTHEKCSCPECGLETRQVLHRLQ